MKQTAVEWLEKELNYIEENAYSSYIDLKINQAKEMEKEQIKNAWLNSLTKGDYNSADEYYNETFKNTEQ
jgi:hypothetical protein